MVLYEHNNVSIYFFLYITIRVESFNEYYLIIDWMLFLLLLVFNNNTILLMVLLNAIDCKSSWSTYREKLLSLLLVID